MTSRWVFLSAAALVMSACATHASTDIPVTDNSLLQRMLVAEDARGTGADGIAPLLEGLASRDTTLRLVAVRGLGRLQPRNRDAAFMIALRDSVPSIRAEAANALAQAVRAVPGVPTRDTIVRPATRNARAILIGLLRREQNPGAAGAMAEAVGRLPLDSREVPIVRAALVDAVLRQTGTEIPSPGFYISPEAWHFERVPLATARGVAAGLYAVSRSPENRTALFRDPHLTIQSLLQAMAADPRDGPHVRNLARLIADGEPRAPAPTVAPPGSCLGYERITRAGDRRVRLGAIDALGGSCLQSGYDLVETLTGFIALLHPKPARGPEHRGDWEFSGHALVALARNRPELATDEISNFVADPRPQVRVFAARAAGILKMDRVLVRLASDRDGNVRAATIAEVARLRKHVRDDMYIAALRSHAYQVVLAAATALAGSTNPSAVAALVAALDRLTAERRENSRDERVAILTRLAELGTPALAPRVTPYLTDFDTTVAAKAASMLTKWKGTRVVAHAAPLPIRPEPLAQIFRTKNLQLRITMADSSGGGTILVRLFTDETPATIARIVRLTRAHYYDGLTFHRIVPNFVIQGGSPGANEQVGDAAFMRDETGRRSHDRGTLGISTRGRDTGDAQFFVNLVDNPRLDHDYTVFGEVISGMDVVDGILEGDVMARVEVIGGTIPG
jgi:cyclophilin family peptidyl-prolyl cis-trans isomerase/HEAT repeat protein